MAPGECVRIEDHVEAAAEVRLLGGLEGNPDAFSAGGIAEDITIQLEAGFNQFHGLGGGDGLGRDQADRLAIEDAGILHDCFSGEKFVDSQDVTDSIIGELELDGAFVRGWRNHCLGPCGSGQDGAGEAGADESAGKAEK